MAALRIFARGSLAPILNHIAVPDIARVVAQIQLRWSSYKSSLKYKTPLHYTDYEVTKDPNEWKYVEHLLRYKTIPKPPTRDVELPSGYKPACALPKDHSYFIERTKNYMQPVYLMRMNRGMRRITTLNKIQGDIYALECDVRKYIEECTGHKIASQINEFAGTIKFKGDCVNRIKEWMNTKGF